VCCKIAVCMPLLRRDATGMADLLASSRIYSDAWAWLGPRSQGLNPLGQDRLGMGLQAGVINNKLNLTMI
jgi:hypothetical protein